MIFFLIIMVITIIIIMFYIYTRLLLRFSIFVWTMVASCATQEGCVGWAQWRKVKS